MVPLSDLNAGFIFLEPPRRRSNPPLDTAPLRSASALAGSYPAPT